MRLILVSIVPVVMALGQSAADPKPGFPPSYEVHISPTAKPEGSVSTTSRPDYWIARGFSLKGIIAKIKDVDENRVILPASADTTTRYDFALVLPQPEDDPGLHRRVEQAIEKYFGVTIQSEQRPMDVFVMTAPHGKAAALKASPDSHSVAQYKLSIRGGVSLSANNLTMSLLSQMLAEQFGRIVIDETGLPGGYDFEA
jgi:uncharacterized protein (TIGR03435 family)